MLDKTLYGKHGIDSGQSHAASQPSLPAFDVHLCLVNSYLFAFQAVSGGEFAHNMRAMFVCIADQHGFCLALGDVYVMSMCLCFL